MYDSNRTAIRVQGQVFIILAAVVIVAAGAFGAGYVVATANNARSTPDMRVFWEAWRLADSEFYYTKPSDQERVYSAVRGMLASYNDQFTLFTAPDISAANTQLMEGEVGGIGAHVALNKDGQLMISEALIGKPAALAGVQTGDIITAIDDHDIKNLALADAVKFIRGPIGTQVKLTIQRVNVKGPITLMVTRQQINIYGRMMDDGIAYVSLSLFSKTAPDELQTEIAQLLRQNPRALIFDLRGNPGGYFDEALKIADLFLPDGPIASEKLSSGDIRKFNGHTGDLAEQIPLVVLVDKGSASAAEIVAGALWDRKRAVLIGQQTYGKGSVQVIHTLSDGSQLRVTHGAWYTPNETPIQQNGKNIGLKPDVVVTIPETPEPNVDPILRAALDYLNRYYF